MPLDSTADLLFNIGANTHEAEGNIHRFRTLMGKDLGDLTGEFDGWATHLLGNLSTVGGALTATTALLGAGLVAVGAFASEAASKYNDYVSEVARGTKTTGLSMEAMSGLKFAADQTNTSYDSLVTGLTKFGTTIDKSNGSTEAYNKTFGRLGISQEQVKAGEKDMLPLLMAVADGFQGLSSKVERTAIARELFSRGGAELVTFLAQGSAGIQKLIDRAGELGLKLDDTDKLHMLKYKASLKEMKDLHEALEITVGKTTLPIAMDWEIAKAAILKTATSVGILKGALVALTNPLEFLVAASAEAGKIGAEINELAASMGKAGDDSLKAAKQVKEANGEWSGLSDLLEKVREKTIDVTSVEGKQAKELEQLSLEVAKTTDHFNQLAKAGKLDPSDVIKQTAALKGMDAAVMGLLQHMDEEVLQKNLDFGHQISALIAEQGERDYAWKVENWAREYNALVTEGEKKKALTAENLAALAILSSAGQAKIDREHAQQVRTAGEELDALMAQQQDKTYAQQQAAWDREIQKRAEKLKQEGLLDEAMLDHLLAVYVAGAKKIDDVKSAEYAAEIGKLNTHLAGMLTAQMTQAQKLAVTYQRDLLAYSDAEEKKALATADGETKAQAIRDHFASLRKQLLAGYTTDLQTLQNSQGWQGVFGSKFGALLKGDEAAMKEWASSSNQGILMVKDSLIALDQMGRQAFDSFAEGMGQNIAAAIVYKTSIGDAMRAAAASTLESVASKALVEAIYATAYGFLLLAEGDPRAASAFTAAAIFGTIGAATALTGRAIAPQQAGSSSGAAAGTSGAGAAGSAAVGPGGAASGNGYNLTVIVQGNTYGVDSLIDAVNEAVTQRDKMLTATNTTTGQVVYR